MSKSTIPDLRYQRYSEWDDRIVFDPLTPHGIYKIEPDGGPASYYDFPKGTLTLNDLIEHKDMDFHRGNIFKACWRWGTKSGTSTEYDARKIIYSACRLLMKITDVKTLRKELQRILDDPQFQERATNE